MAECKWTQKKARQFITLNFKKLVKLVAGKKIYIETVHHQLNEIIKQWDKLTAQDQTEYARAKNANYERKIKVLNDRLSAALKIYNVRFEFSRVNTNSNLGGRNSDAHVNERRQLVSLSSSARPAAQATSSKTALTKPLTGTNVISKESNTPFAICPIIPSTSGTNSNTQNDCQSVVNLSTSNQIRTEMDDSACNFDFKQARLVLLSFFENKFSGNRLEWHQFEKIMESVVTKNKKLCGAEKIVLLFIITTDIAYDSISKYSLSEQGYLNAMNKLRNRFQMKEIGSQQILKPLEHLTPIENDDDVDALLKLASAIDKSVALAERSKYAEYFKRKDIIPRIRKLVPPSITYRARADQMNTDGYLKLIDHQILAADLNLSGFGVKSFNHDGSSNRNLCVQIKSKCRLCGDGNHFENDCEKYPSPGQKFGQIRHLGLCFTCLEAGHPSRNCTSNVKCPKCNGRHFAFVCVREGGRK